MNLAHQQTFIIQKSIARQQEFEIRRRRNTLLGKPTLEMIMEQACASAAF